LGHVDFGFVHLRQAFQARLDLVFEGVAHRPEDDVAIGGQRLIGRARAAGRRSRVKADLDLSVG